MSMRTYVIGGLLALSVTSGAWSEAHAQDASRPDSPAGSSGFAADGLAAMQQMMDAAVREGRIPSAVAMLARDSVILWMGTAGEMGPGHPMRRDAIIPLASVGKMYTAVAAMLLVERGVIALEDPVSTYIPEFGQAVVRVTDESGHEVMATPREAITIHHLLTHTGGLTVTGDDFWAAWDAHSGRTTTTHLARALAALPLQAQPGTAFAYGQTGASYEVLGAVIEIATGQTLEAFMQENIFDPLALRDTHFYLPEGKAERMPSFFRRVDGVLERERPYGVDFPRSTFFHGGGGVEASPQDFLRFARLFLDGGSSGGVRLLSPETIDRMMTDQLGDVAPRDGWSWGYGAALQYAEDAEGTRTLRQYGWIGGGYAIAWVDPVDRLVAYFAFPLMPPGDNELLLEFARLVEVAKIRSGQSN
jgi:CubicO group peptidase (beta-lactamase class C family)